MADLTKTPLTVSFKDQGFLDAGITASATTVTIGSIIKYPSGAKTTQGFDSTAGFAVIELGGRFERISFGAASVTSNVTSLTDVRRGLSQVSTTANFTAGTGLAWPKGAKITITNDPVFFQNTAYIDLQNTFSDRVDFSGTTHSGVRLLTLTTTEQDALTAVNGDIIYNETANLVHGYVGGAWTSLTAGTVADASATVAGKVEIATAAEAAAATGAGGSGALVVLPASLGAQVSGDATAVEGGVPILNATKVVDVSLGGTGVVSPTLNSLVLGAGTSAMTLIAPSTSGNVLTSDGTTWASTVPAHDYDTKAIATADTATTGTSSTAEGFHTSYTVAANDLVVGTMYRMEAWGHLNTDAGNNTIKLFMGTNSITLTVAATSGADSFHLIGTAVCRTTGGSGTCIMTLQYQSQAEYVMTEPTSTVTDTTGTLDFKISATMSDSNSGNNFHVENSTVTKIEI